MNKDYPLFPHRPISFRTVYLLVIISAAALVFCFALDTVVGKAMNPSAAPTKSSLDRIVKQMGLSYTLGAMAVWIAEELVFRGYLLQKLRRRFPLLIAVVVSSALFGFLHAFKSLPHVVFATLIGMYFAWLMIKTESIFAPIVAHVAYNVTGFYLFLPLSGITEIAAQGQVPDTRLAFLPWYAYLIAAGAIALCVPLLLKEIRRTSRAARSAGVATSAGTPAYSPMTS